MIIYYNNACGQEVSGHLRMKYYSCKNFMTDYWWLLEALCNERHKKIDWKSFVDEEITVEKVSGALIVF